MHACYACLSRYAYTRSSPFALACKPQLGRPTSITPPRRFTEGTFSPRWSASSFAVSFPRARVTSCWHNFHYLTMPHVPIHSRLTLYLFDTPSLSLTGKDRSFQVVSRSPCLGRGSWISRVLQYDLMPIADSCYCHRLRPLALHYVIVLIPLLLLSLSRSACCIVHLLVQKSHVHGSVL